MDRGTLTQATVSISKNMAEMIEETKDSGKKDNKLVCHVSSKARFYRCLGGIKIIIDCSFDGKGYFDTKDSCEFVSRWFKELKFFENNFKLSELQNNFTMPVKQADRMVEVDKPSSSQQTKGSSSNKRLNGVKNIISTSSDNIGTADTLEN